MKIIVSAAFIIMSSGFSLAQSVEKKLTFQERYEALGKQSAEEMDKLLNPVVQPKTGAEARKRSDDIQKAMDKYSVEFFDLAKSEPKDELALKCSAHAYSQGNDSLKAKILEFWLEHYADKPELIPYFLPAARDDRSADYCKRLAEKSKSRAVKGMALYATAEAIIQKYEGPPSIFDNNKKEKKVISSAERMKLVDDAAKQIHDVLKEYGDENFKDFNGKEKSIAEFAQDTLYLAEHLALGRMAPEFEAESLRDGKKHKLTDYRGKIVVLDFYYYFGGYTHDRDKVVPALRRTTAKFKDQMVQVLSINVDEKKDSTARLFQMEKNLSWPQLWDGNEKGVAKSYMVVKHTQSTPYIVDANGVIRGKLKWGADLDALVTDLLKEKTK